MKQHRPFLLVVLGLLVAALVVGVVRSGEDAPKVDGQLVALRERAALAPCPTGLGLDTEVTTARCLGGGPDVDLRAPLTTGPTIVNVWGSWCPPCLREVPDLIRFSDAARGKVAVVGVLLTDTDESALTYAATVGMHYPSVVDPDGDLSRAVGGSGPPKTLFLEADGMLAFTHYGQLSYDQLTALVRQHLGVSV